MNIKSVLAAALVASASAAASAQELTWPLEASALVAHAHLAARQPQVVLVSGPAQAAPIDRGFRALGRAGKTGRIKGPGLGQGDGAYLVVESGAWRVVITVKTGYVDGTFTLQRDPATGKDLLGFNGRSWDVDRGGWRAPVNTMEEGRVTYDPGEDSGTITWMLDGRRRDDPYRGGALSNRGMTISLSGYAHEFSQD